MPLHKLIRILAASTLTILLTSTLFATTNEPTPADDLSATAASETSYSIGDAVDATEVSASVSLGEQQKIEQKCDGGKKSYGKTAAGSDAAAGAYKGCFFDNDFSYLCDPCYDGWHLGENLKRMSLGSLVTVDVGGQFRLRQMDLNNFRFDRSQTVATNGFGLTGLDDDYLLQRSRLYMNTEIGEYLRAYVEMLDAVSSFERYRPPIIEENRAEVQNAFIDIRTGQLTTRIGRQELLLGAQRVVSPLDWANTRRTFEGVRLLWKGDDWDIDGIWSRPLRRQLNQIDPPHQDRQLYGIYSTYKGMCRDKVDLYWLALDYQDVGFRYDTIGLRYYGNTDAWLYEFEGNYQFGDNADGSNHSAGSWTTGIGRKFECALWKPTLWAYYDWASGDDNGNGYHHYEPLAHKYLGWMDLFGRRNIEDANLQLILQPHKRAKLIAWYHVFRLQNRNDVPYNVNMTAFDGLAPGVARNRDLGEEIDLSLSVTLTPRMQAVFGYSHFFTGNFYNTTAGLPTTQDADFFWAQYHVDF